jgi:hypothetical protein
MEEGKGRKERGVIRTKRGLTGVLAGGNKNHVTLFPRYRLRGSRPAD